VNTTLSLVVACALFGQQRNDAPEPILTKAPGVEQILRPKLTLLEEEEAKAKGTDTWIIDEFVIVSPRMITVDVPGKQPSRRMYLYMLWRVTNRGETPRHCVPGYTLVDDRGGVYIDIIAPKAQRAIQAREDPLRPLENSISAIRMLEGSKEEGLENSLYGVALWDATPLPDPPAGQRRTTIDPKLNSFDILVSGLSNGFKMLEDPATGQKKIQRKTLQLKFARPGDEFRPHEREVRYLGHEWIYQ